jgi:hypothetical protein
MTTNELFVHPSGRTEIDSDLDCEEVPKPAATQHSVDFVIRKPSFVVRHDGNFPGLQETTSAVILPKKFGAIARTLILAAAFISGDVGLGTNEGISRHLEPS